MNTPPPVTFPEASIDLVRDLVPAVRELLQQGLSPEFLRGCVRIGGFLPFGGGMKADLVGGLRIDVNAVLKLGTDELDRHESLMNAVNVIRPRTFPQVLKVVRLPDNRRLLLMENLGRYVTLLDTVYHRHDSITAFPGLISKTFSALEAVWSLRPPPSAKFTARAKVRGPDGFAVRLRERLDAVIAADPDLDLLRTSPGVVLGKPIPPIDDLLDQLTVWLRENIVHPVQQHGDPHLGNLMLRAHGKGYVVRLIDPNPEVGLADPFYDYGKLFHWADSPGWAKISPEDCHARWTPSHHGKPWRLDASVSTTCGRVERRRLELERLLRKECARRLAPRYKNWEPRLAIATASAHIGMAALLNHAEQKTARRFTLAYSLRRLADWHSAI